MHSDDKNISAETAKNTDGEENLRDKTDALTPCKQEVLDEISDHTILPFDDLVREALAEKAEAIRALCGDTIICWFEIGRKLNESWAIFEAEKAPLSAYQKWVRVEFRFGDTTESKHRRAVKYLDENPGKLADVPKPYLIEAGWNKVQMTLTMEENLELGRKGFLKSSRFTKGGIFLRFTHLSTEFELTALTSRQLERLGAGKNPDGKKSDPNQPSGSGKSPKPAIETSDDSGSNPSPQSGEPSESQAECERLRTEIHALKVDLKVKASEVDKLKVDMERKDSRINELEKLLRQQQGHLNADSTPASGPESLDEPESKAPMGDEAPNLSTRVEEPPEQDCDDADGGPAVEHRKRDEFTQHICENKNRAASLAEAEKIEAANRKVG